MHSSPSDKKDDTGTVQHSDVDDTLSLIKGMSPGVKEVIYGWYKELCQVNLAERLINVHKSGDWWDKKVSYEGPLPDGVRDDMSEMHDTVYPTHEHDTPEIYNIVIDDFDDLEVLLVAIRYGEHGGDGEMNAFYDAKTFRPLLLDDRQYTGKLFVKFDTPMEDFVKRQLEDIRNMFAGW